MADIFTIALDAIYASPIGTNAVLSVAAGETFRVIDKSAGVELQLKDSRLPTMTPAACIRNAELAAKGVTLASLIGTNITLNGVTWKILSTQPRPVPSGEANGEYFLILRRT